MGRKKSIDDLKSAHLHFDKSAKMQLQSMPQYFNDQASALVTIYTDIETASKSRTVIGVQKTTDLVQRSAWTEKATDALSRTKLYLRATAPDNVREYFPESSGSLGRMIDRLYAIAKVLTVSEHFDHEHIGAFKAELEALKTEGETIFGAASVSATEQKTEVEKLKGLKEKWENQYQKVKFLFRGYFYGTSTDWTKFFSDKRLARTAPGQDNNSASGD